VPRWRIQCQIPGVTKSNWTLTRTGATRWEITDGNIQWVMTYSDTSPNIVIQCYVNGQQYMTTFNGRPVWSGYINGWAIRICAIGVNIPKEYIVTTSDVELCASFPVYSAFQQCGPTTGYVISIANGALNGTFTLPQWGNVASNGCLSYRTQQPIASIRISMNYVGQNSIQLDVPMYLSVTYSGGNAPFLSLGGTVNIPAEWFPPDVDYPNCSIPVSAAFVSGLSSTVVSCDEPVTLQGGQCSTMFNSVARNGTATVTPIHDDAWTPR